MRRVFLTLIFILSLLLLLNSVSCGGDKKNPPEDTSTEQTNPDTLPETEEKTEMETTEFITTDIESETVAETVAEEETTAPAYTFAGASTDTVLYAKNFGAVGDGKTDDGKAIYSAVLAAAEQHATLVFEENCHYYICETGVKNGFDTPFNLVGASCVTIDGNNSVFVMAPGLRYIYEEGCSNTKIINCKFDYEVSVYLVGHVTAVKGNSVEYDVDIEPYVYNFDFSGVNGFSIMYNEGIQNRPHMFMKSMKRTGERHVVVEYASSHHYTVGSVVFLPNPGIGHCISQMLQISGNSGAIVLENIEIRQAPSFVSAISSNTAEIYFNNVQMTAGDENNREIKMVGWRDGYHCKDNRSPIHWDNCIVDVLFDDVFNISNTLGHITFVNSNSDFSAVNYEHYSSGQKAAFDCKAGDVIDIIDHSTGKYYGCATVRAAMANPDGSTRIILDYQSEIKDVTEGFLIANRSTCAPGSTITDCKFTGTYRFRRSLRVENTVFDNLVIWIMDEGGVEGLIPGDIDFVNCTFNSGEIQIDAYNRDNSRRMSKIGSVIDNIGFWGCTFNDGAKVTTETKANYTINDTYTESDLYTVKNPAGIKASAVVPTDSDFSDYAVTYDWTVNTSDVSNGEIIKKYKLSGCDGYEKLTDANGFMQNILKLGNGDSIISAFSKEALPIIYTQGNKFMVSVDYYVKTAADGGFAEFKNGSSTLISDSIFAKAGVGNAIFELDANGLADGLGFILADGGEVYVGRIMINLCDNENPTYLQLLAGHTFEWNADVTVSNAKLVEKSSVSGADEMKSDENFGDSILCLTKAGKFSFMTADKYYLKHSTYTVKIQAYVAKACKNAKITSGTTTVCSEIFGDIGLCTVEFDWGINSGSLESLTISGTFGEVYIGNVTVTQSRSAAPASFLDRSDYYSMTKNDVKSGYTFDFTDGNLFEFEYKNYASLKAIGGKAEERMTAAGFGDTVYYFTENTNLLSLSEVVGDGKRIKITMKIYDVMGNIATSGTRGAFVLLNMTNGAQNSAEVNYTVEVDPDDSRIITLTFNAVPPSGTTSLLLYELTDVEFYIGKMEIS